MSHQIYFAIVLFITVLNETVLDDFHFRWLNIEGFDAAFLVSITLLFNHLN